MMHRAGEHLPEVEYIARAQYRMWFVKQKVPIVR